MTCCLTCNVNMKVAPVPPLFDGVTVYSVSSIQSVDVPVIAPVLVLNVTPGGKDAAEIANEESTLTQFPTTIFKAVAVTPVILFFPAVKVVP